jgi:hypothetical protein
MTRRLGKQLRTIHRDLLLIFLIEVCLTSGDEETVNSLCKSMTQYLSSIPKKKRIELYLKLSKHLELLYRLMEDDDSLFRTE